MLDAGSSELHSAILGLIKTNAAENLLELGPVHLQAAVVSLNLMFRLLGSQSCPATARGQAVENAC